MTSLPLTLSLAPFPTGAAMNADDFGQQLISNMSAVLNGNLVLGQTFGTMPSSNIGPWFDGTKWLFWNPVSGTYTIIPVQAPISTIHNGQMQIWQRGINFPSVSGTIFTGDRYLIGETMVTGVATVSRHTVNFMGTDTTPNTAFALRISVTTPQATVSVNETFTVNQRVERLFARPLFNQPSSLSLVLQCSVSGTYCVSIRDAGVDWSYVQECVITTPNVPQSFLMTNIPSFPTDTGDWGTNETDSSYSISICASSGATYQTPPNIWTVGNFIATENQSNLFAAIGNTLDITLIQHEPGPICNPFIYVPFDHELASCQRYYCQSYDYGIFPGTVTSDASAILYNTLPAGGNSTVGFVRFPRPLRAAPGFPSTLNIYSPTTGAISRIRDNIGAVDRVVSAVFASSKEGIGSVVATTAFTGGNISFFHYTASADI